MDVTPKLKKLNKKFIEQYLKAYGLEDIKKYLKGDACSMDDPFDYPNMEQAIELLHYHINEKAKHKKIGIVIDSDIDGYCSSALIMILLKAVGKENVEVPIFYHEAKQHGIHDCINDICAKNLDLLIVPDAGSNDVEDCKILSEVGVDVIILDHHMINKDNPYAIVVNPYLNENLNKNISGAGVAYKFCQAYCHYYEDFSCDEIGCTEDIVAVSLIADDCTLANYENRAFVNLGLNDISNEFLEYMFEKKCTRRGINSEGVGWDIAPLGNALARSDNQETKLIFFEGLIGQTDFKDALKEMSKVKRLQDEAVKLAMEELEPTIDYSKKAIIGFSDSANKSYLGLIANKFCGAYNKPTFMLRELNSTTWTGSMRSPIDLAERINQSGLAEAQGHEAACGITIKKANLERFKEWLENLEIEENPNIQVTACVKPEELNVDLMQTIQDNKILFGKGLESPTFYIKCNVTKDNIFVFKKKTTTIKANIGDLNCIKFFAKEDMVNDFTEYDNFTLELVVGNCCVNEWNGEKNPQVEILNYEITPIKNENQNWEELF